MNLETHSIEIDGFRVIRQPPASPEAKAALVTRDRLTDGVLSDFQSPPTGGRISGSFIYAHPPDYHGRPTLRYGVPEWRILFRELKALGIDTVIFQASTWLDFRECYYPSDLFKDFTTWNVVGPMLEAAGDEKLTVFLAATGVLLADEHLGVLSGDIGKAKACALRERDCYRELVARYSGAFHGYYLASETGFMAGDTRNRNCYHTFFEWSTNEIKAITPHLPILSSPYTVHAPGQEAEAVDYLTELHRNCPLTALAPQDSIGTFNNLSFLDRGLGIWKTVCANLGFEFWVNCESFSIRAYAIPVVDIQPAGFKRFALQLDTAQRLGAKKLITWEAAHFMDPAGSEAARRLRREYLEHRQPTPA